MQIEQCNNWHVEYVGRNQLFGTFKRFGLMYLCSVIALNQPWKELHSS